MYIAEVKIEDILSAIKAMNPLKDESVFIAVGEKSWANIEQLVEVLIREGISFFGGIFPGVITGGRKYEKGIVCSRIPVTARPVIVENVSASEYDLSILKSKEYACAKSMLVFADGLANHIDRLLRSLSDTCDHSVTFCGGGTGSISFRKQPCVFSSEGFFEDAAVICPAALYGSSGIQHGWRRLQGPYVATKTDGNILYELNYKPALEVYCDIVEQDCGKQIKADDFYKLAMRYPFGLHKEGMEDIVRDPLVLKNGGGLVCCGDIPENAIISILKGEYEHLIKAAGKAADDCLEQVASCRVSHALVIDCISRFYFLGEFFERELDIINSKLAMAPGSPEPFGVLSLGEISSYGEGDVQLFNKTTVLTVFKEGETESL